MSEPTQRSASAADDAEFEAQHAWLVSRDHNVGVEAEIGRLNRDLLLLTQENAALRRKVTTLTRRRETLQATVRKVRKELEQARRRNARLTGRIGELEQRPRSLARRVAGRLRRAVR